MNEAPTVLATLIVLAETAAQLMNLGERCMSPPYLLRSGPSGDPQKFMQSLLTSRIYGAGHRLWVPSCIPDHLKKVVAHRVLGGLHHHYEQLAVR